MPRLSALLPWLVLGAYLLAFPYHPAFRSPNELSRLWQSRAIVDHGTLSLNRTLLEMGYVGDLSIKDGVLYPSKAPLLSLLGVPVYAALRGWAALRSGGAVARVPEVPQVFWSRLFITILPTLVMLVFLRRFLGTYVSGPVADALVVTYALGSMALNYSLMFLSHQLTAVLAFFAFYALWRTGRGEWREVGHLVAGAFAGAVLLCEYTGALTVLGLAAYALLDRWTRQKEIPTAQRLRSLARAAGLATVGALPFVLALMAYHQACFGHPLHSGYLYLNDPGYQGWHVGGFLGIRFPDPRALVLSFFSPLRGLFTVSPFLLASVFGLRALWRTERSLFWLSVLLLAGNTYFTSAFAYDSWGWSAGPRHLTPMIPFLLVPCGLLLARLSQAPTPMRAVLGGVAAGTCVASVLVTGTVALVNYVPPELSTSLFGLAVPMFLDGYLPPTVPLFLGLVNPASGALVWGLILAAGVVLAVHLLSLSPARLRPHTALGGALCCVAVLGVLWLATRLEADAGTREFLKRGWFSPPGAQVQFWR